MWLKKGWSNEVLRLIERWKTLHDISVFSKFPTWIIVITWITHTNFSSLEIGQLHCSKNGWVWPRIVLKIVEFGPCIVLIWPNEVCVIQVITWIQVKSFEKTHLYPVSIASVRLRSIVMQTQCVRAHLHLATATCLRCHCEIAPNGSQRDSPATSQQRRSR